MCQIYLHGEFNYNFSVYLTFEMEALTAGSNSGDDISYSNKAKHSSAQNKLTVFLAVNYIKWKPGNTILYGEK